LTPKNQYLKDLAKANIFSLDFFRLVCSYRNIISELANENEELEENCAELRESIEAIGSLLHNSYIEIGSIKTENKMLLTLTRPLLTIAGGCSKHRSYKAKRAPRVACAECEEMWEAQGTISNITEVLFKKEED